MFQKVVKEFTVDKTEQKNVNFTYD